MFIKKIKSKKALQLVGSIHSRNSNKKVALSIGAVVTVLIGWISIALMNFSLSNYLQPQKLAEVLAILPTMIFVLFVHECIHVLFFRWFGRGKARMKVKRDKEIGAIVIHQINPEVFYRRNEMLVILLSPIALITVGIILLNAYVLFPFLLWVNILLNAIGSSTDLYVSFRLMKDYNSNHVINFDSSEHILNVYKH